MTETTKKKTEIALKVLYEKLKELDTGRLKKNMLGIGILSPKSSTIYLAVEEALK